MCLLGTLNAFAMNKSKVNQGRIERLELKDIRPIHKATLACNIKQLKNLIRRRANVNAQAEYGFTPLHIAAQSGSVQAVKILLENGADIESRTAWGQTPLTISCGYDHIKVLELLIQYGAKVYVQPSKEEHRKSTMVAGAPRSLPPILYACQMGHVNIVEMLLDNGAKVNRLFEYEIYSDSDCFLEKRYPIHFACQQGHLDILRLFLAIEADIDIQANSGATPLYLACMHNKVALVKELLKAGANQDLKNIIYNNKPLDVALKCGNTEVVEMLRHYKKTGKNDTAKKKKLHKCESCDKIGKFMKCSGCRKVYYCSVACQTKAWPTHKEVCKKI